MLNGHRVQDEKSISASVCKHSSKALRKVMSVCLGTRSCAKHAHSSKVGIICKNMIVFRLGVCVSNVGSAFHLSFTKYRWGCSTNLHIQVAFCAHCRAGYNTSAHSCCIDS